MTDAAPAPLITVERESLATRLLGFWRGHDVFLSYAWSDGRSFALSLMQLLSDRGWRVFLDDSELPGGSELASLLGNALRRSTVLIAVTTPGSVRSKHVVAEIDIFRQTGRPIVPIFVDQLSSLDGGPLVDILSRRVFIERRGANPDGELVRQLENSLRFVRRARLRLAAISTIALLLLALSIFALVQRHDARQQADEISLQLDARRIEDKLSTGRQSEALGDAISSAQRAQALLGRVPNETWRALWLAYEGSREIARLDVPLGTDLAAFAPDGRVVALGSDHRVMALASPGGFRPWTSSGTLLPSGRAFAEPDNGATQIVDVDGRPVLRLAAGAPDLLVDISLNGSCAWSPDRRRVLVHGPGAVKPAAVDTSRLGQLAALHLSPDGKLLVVVDESGEVQWFAMNNLSKGRSVVLGSAAAFAISDDASHVAALVDGVVKITRSDAMDVLHFTPSRPQNQVGAPTPPVALSIANNNTVAVAYDNTGTVLVFGNQGQLAVPPILGSETPRPTLSPDGRRLAVADATGRLVRLFDLAPRAIRPLTEAGVAGQQTTSLKVCGQYLIWGGMTGSLRVSRLSVAGTSKSWSLSSPLERIAAIACAAKGIVVADRDGRVLWFSRVTEGAASVPLSGEARQFATRDDVVVGLGSTSLTFWRPTVSTKPIRTVTTSNLTLPPGAASAIQFFDDGDLVVANDRIDRSPASVSKWRFLIGSGVPRRIWRRDLPGLIQVTASSVSVNGQEVYVGGTFDVGFSIDATGYAKRFIEGILRPAGDTAAALSDRRVAIASMWGAIAILDSGGRRLLTPAASLQAPMLFASDPKGERLFIGDSGGKVFETILDSPRLLTNACYAKNAQPCRTGG